MGEGPGVAEFIGPCFLGAFQVPSLLGSPGRPEEEAGRRGRLLPQLQWSSVRHGQGQDFLWKTLGPGGLAGFPARTVCAPLTGCFFLIIIFEKKNPFRFEKTPNAVKARKRQGSLAQSTGSQEPSGSCPSLRLLCPEAHNMLPRPL